ncbi:hypothetical protein [Streptomyces sp. CB02115]|uniref:hypothetical protein n=1 Tax=Streptomyces sp. CB02115 TaxID=1703939 RepID=UPI00093E7DEC|nr:hypothetical protein [Streptomyces sp. CB02115]
MMESKRTEEGAAASAVPGTEAVSPGQRLRRVRDSAPEPQLDFPPVRNGLDYLVSVVSHLDERESVVTPRDVKYAVLHLEAAVELLLKARLNSAHWALVFADLDKVTPKALKEFTFRTVGAEQALGRLQALVGVDVSSKDRGAVAKLVKYRNRLQHFGFTENANDVENLAGEVLDFLVRFIDDQVVPYLQDDQERAEAEQQLLDVREGLSSIRSFVEERMTRLGAELKADGVENRTVECPGCEQVAVVVSSGSGGCRFCSSAWAADELAGHFDTSGWEGEGPWMECPTCQDWTLGAGVRLRSDPGTALYFCFVCVRGFLNLEPCDGCARPVESQDGGGPAMCGGCAGFADGEEVRPGLDYEHPEDYGFDSGEKR